MLIRALIVLLVVLNLGAAAWWLTRTVPAPVPPPALPAGIAQLQLMDETPAPSAAVSGNQVATATPRAVGVCFSLGPFASQASANLAQEAIKDQLVRARLREVPGVSSSGYQVVLPPAPSLEDAQAAAERIGAAGFDDFFVVRQGEQANSIALGRYRSREAAERRVSQLQAADFAVQLQPVGRAAPSAWWLDAGAAEGADPATLANAASRGAPQPLECTALR